MERLLYDIKSDKIIRSIKHENIQEEIKEEIKDEYIQNIDYVLQNMEDETFIVYYFSNW